MMSALADWYPGDRVLDFCVIVAAAVALVSSTAWGVCWLLSRRPAARHCVLLSALMASLASPILAFAFVVSGRSFINVPLLLAQDPSVSSPAMREEMETPRDMSPSRGKIYVPSEPAHPIAPESVVPADRAAPAATEQLLQNRPVVEEPKPAAVDPVIGRADPFRSVAVAVLLTWTCGTVIVIFGVMRSWRFLQRLRRSVQPISDASQLRALDEARRLLGARKAPAVGISKLVRAPLAAGVVRPVVVLPRGLPAAINEDQLCDILMHEIAHVERRDNLLVLLQLFAKALFWPIPFIHLLNRELETAREEVCDNHVLVCRDAVSYGETLWRVAHMACCGAMPAGTVGILHWRGKLENRICGLIDKRRNTMTRMHPLIALGILALFLSASALLCGTSIVVAQQAQADTGKSIAIGDGGATASPVATRPESNLIRPIPGSLFLCGKGEFPDYVFKSFAQLCQVNDPESKNFVIVFSDNQVNRAHTVLKSLCGDKVELVDVSSDDAIRKMPDGIRERIKKCSGVWLDLSSRPSEEKFANLMVREVFEQGKVVGAAGNWASQMLSISPPENDKWGGLQLVPHCRMHLVATNDGKHPEATTLEKGLVHWLVPSKSALVFVRGGIASSHGSFLVRMVTVPLHTEPVDTKLNLTNFEYGDRIAGSDFLEPLRRVSFDPAKRQPIRSDFSGPEKGTLILNGGGGVSDSTFQSFIEAAGGKEARFVCIPTAGEDEDKSYSARRLKELGCNNIEILHTRDPRVADRDTRMLKLLDEANAVWIDGGRTYRVMEAYQETQVQKKIHALLQRGGVFGGSSAGCQVAGELLVRGNPSNADQLEYPPFSRGLGLLTGVVFDAHFRQRHREYEFGYLIVLHPGLLGIGVDEGTSIVVKGEIATVEGDNGVTLFDASQPVATGPTTNAPRQTFLKSGSRFNLKTRKQIQ